MLKINNEFESAFRMYRKKYYELNMHMSEYIWTYKEMHTLLKKYLDQMNLASSYFQLSFRSMRTSMILWITKLFDEKENTSIDKFLCFIEANIRYMSLVYKMHRTNSGPQANWIRDSKDVSIKDINEHRAKLKSLKPTINKIITLRDKYHAHLDKAFIRNRKAVLVENKLKWEELEYLPNLCNEIIVFYSNAYDGEYRLQAPVNWNDLENLLKPLAEHGIG